MAFYNIAHAVAAIWPTCISDCYQLLGRSKTIDLLDDMKQLGFRESTRSGLSFATDDLITPDSQGAASSPTPKRRCCKFNKLYQRGIITEGERYNQVLDAWTHARERSPTEMMSDAGDRLSRQRRLREPDLS